MSFFSAIKNFFVAEPKQQPTMESAPYKVPEPAATTPIPLVAEVAPVVAAKKKPAPKKPAAAPEKPVAAKISTRKPRAPKV